MCWQESAGREANRQAEDTRHDPPIQYAPPSPFAGRLQEGERLLWEGVPDTRLFALPKVVAGLLVIIPVLPLVLLAESWKTGTPLVWLSAKTLVVSVLVFVLMAVYLYQQSRSQAEAAAYALSNRRVFIRRMERLTSQDWRPRIDEFALPTLRPKLRTLGGGRGAITFGGPVWQYEKAFRAIPEAAAVFGLLTSARAALAGPSTALSGPYYAQTKTKPTAPAPSKIADGLRAGETILWEGGMDHARYFWGQIGMMTFVAVVFSSLAGIFLALRGGWTPLWQGLIFASLAAACYAVAWFEGGSMARNRRYILTNQRVLVVKGANGPRPQTDERELWETAAMKLKAGRDGFGTVIFEKKTRFVWHGQSGTVETYEFSFKAVADAQAVFAQIQTARLELKPQFSPDENHGNYFVPPPSRPLP